MRDPGTVRPRGYTGLREGTLFAFDAIALASVVVSGVVALAAVLAQLRNSHEDRIHAETMAREAFNRGQIMAASEHQRGGRADAYVQVLEAISNMLIVLERQGTADRARLQALIDTELWAEMPALTARLSAYGSPEVRRLYDRWLDRFLAWLKSPEGSTEREGLARQLDSAHDALGDRINHELSAVLRENEGPHAN